MELIPTILVFAILALFVLVVAALGFALWRFWPGESRIRPQVAPSQDPPGTLLSELAARVAALEVVVDGLPSLWEEQVRRASNHSKRALDAERRAAEISEAESGGEEDAVDPQQLQLLDGAGGAGGGLYGLSGNVGGAPSQAELQARADALLAQGM